MEDVPDSRGNASRIWKPRFGQLVRLTFQGMNQVGGINTPEQLNAQNTGFKVTRVSLAHTEPEVYNVDVDGPFAHLLLTSCDVEPVEWLNDARSQVLS